MSKAIQSNLVGVVNETAVRGLAMCALIKKYIGITAQFGLRTMGDNPAQNYPCIYVEPKNYNPDMVAVGKYYIILSFKIYWYVTENDPENIVLLATSIGHNLEKLFSNNALNDLDTTGSKNFDSYEPYWTEVLKFDFMITPTFENPTQNKGGQFMRMGMATIDIRTWIIR